MSLYPLQTLTDGVVVRLRVRTSDPDRTVAVVEEDTDGRVVVRVAPGVTIETMEEEGR
jgi:hypothetical protein